jgi:hypothetical protein
MGQQFRKRCTSPVLSQLTRLTHLRVHERSKSKQVRMGRAGSGVAVATPSSAPGATPLPPSPPAACVPASATNPTAIVGYVMSRDVDGDRPRRFQATVTGLEVKPQSDTLVEWVLGFRDTNGAAYHLRVYVPKGLTAPFASGQSISATTSSSGGGPNRRLELVLLAADGTVLLALGDAPPGWSVERGAPAGSQSGGSYVERRYGVRFTTPEGKAVPLPADSWTSVDVHGCGYLLWGSAAERTLGPGKQAPPDYIGGWVDFAIVRAALP